MMAEWRATTCATILLIAITSVRTVDGSGYRYWYPPYYTGIGRPSRPSPLQPTAPAAPAPASAPAAKPSSHQTPSASNRGPKQVFHERSSLDCSSWQQQLDQDGATVFLFDDATFTIPVSVSEMTSVTCPRLRRSDDRLKAVIKSCLKPFAQTIAGFLLRGARSAHSQICDSNRGAERFVTDLACLRQSPSVTSQLHQVMNVYASRLMQIHAAASADDKIGLTYCSYMSVRKQLRTTARKASCSLSSVKYLVSLMDGVYNQTEITSSLSANNPRSNPGRCRQLIQRLPILSARSVTPLTSSSFLPLFLVVNDIS